VDPAYLAAHVEQDRLHWYFRGRRALGEFGEPVGIERDDALLAVAHAAGLDVRRGALPDDLPVTPGWADVVLLLDVLEHLDDDGEGLRAAGRTLRDDGRLVVTVPAYPWLWSGHDLALGHRRRYVAAGLRRLVADAGYRVERLSYFNTVLFPAVATTRLYKRLRRDARHDLERPAPALNTLLEWLFALERHVVTRQALPFGTSLLVVARRS
jgi:SAM-dependent methyltransferase